MKRQFFYAAALAAITLTTGCSSDDLTSGTNTTQQAIGFDSYLGRSTIGGESRGSVKTVSDIATSGFGVYAYQSTAQYTGDNKAFDPNLMNNVKVTGTTGTDQTTTYTWSYSPTRYWPVSDYVSFLAYAPYSSSYKLVSSSSAESGDRTYLSGFEVNATITDQVDLLWNKTAHLNETKSSNTNNSTVGKVKMSFAHALSRIGLSISSPYASSSTKITIESVSLSGSSSETTTGAFTKSGILNLAATSTDNTTSTASWTLSTTGDNLKQAFTFTSTDNLQNNELTKSSTDDGESSTGNATCTNKDDSYLMILPEDFSSDNSSLYITVKYKVQTTDNSVTGAEVTNTVTQQIKKKFEAGKAYTLKISVGLTPIEFDVDTTIAGWDTADSSDDISI